MQIDELVLSDVHLVTNNHKTRIIDVKHAGGTMPLQVVSSRFLFQWPLDLKPNESKKSDELDAAVDFEAYSDEDGDLVVQRRTNQNAQKVITLEHSLASSLSTVGFQVWPGAIFLCDYVLHNQHQFRDKIILELGAGTGLCSIVAALFAKRVLCTDYNEEILSVCQRNADNNCRLIEDVNKIPHGSLPIKVKRLDWLHEEPFESDDSGASIWKWTKEDLDDIENVDVILASDVIYETNLTDHFFELIKKLLTGYPNRILFLSLERRLNFTLEELDVCCPAYDHFIDWTKRLCEKPSLFKVKQIGVDAPSLFSFGRTKYLELWQLSCQ